MPDTRPLDSPAAGLPLLADVTVQAGDVVIATDRSGRVTFWNDEAIRCLGYERSEALGMPLVSLAPWRSGARLDIPAVAAGGEFAGGVETRRRDGRSVHLYLYAVVGRDADGRGAGVILLGREVSDFWRVQEDARLAEERYRLIFERSSDAVVVAAADGTVIDANPAAGQMFGYRPSEMRGRALSGLVDEDRRSEAKAVLARLRRRGELAGTYRFRSATGAALRVELRAVMVRLGDEQHIVAIGRDVTERDRLLDQLRDAETRYRTIYHSAGDAILLETPDGAILDVNDNACQLLGYSRDELLQLTLRDLLPGPACDAYPQIIETTLRRGSFRAETLNRRKDGSLVPTSITCALAQLDGQPRIIAILRDNTERRRAEQQLRRERDTAQAYLQLAGDIIIALDTNGRITLLNDKGARLLGTTPQEALGRDWFRRYVPERDRDRVAGAFRRIISGQLAPVEHYTNPVLTPGGERTINWHNALIRDDDGTITGTLSSGQDATDLLDAQQQLQHSEQRYRQALNAMHDGIHLCGPDLRINWANDSMLIWLSELGLSARILGKTVNEAFPFLPPVVADEYRHVLNTGIALVTTEQTVLGGTHIHTETRKVPVIEHGRPVAVLTKIRDITDTWNQQQVIQQAEQRYRRLVQLSPDGIAVHQDGRIVFVNPAGARLLGYAHPDEMTGLPVLDVVHPDDRAAVVQRITSALRDGRAGAPAGERFRRKDGTWQPVEVLNAPYVWDGRPAVLVICRDTGERDRLRIQAEHAAAHARAIIAASPAAVAAELDGRIVYANQRFADLYGYGAAEVVGLGVDAIIAAHDRARVAGYTKARRAGQDAPSEYHFTGLRRDGTTLDVAIVVTTYELHGQQYTLGFLRPV